MNRVLLSFLLSVFVFTACEGPEGPPGRDGESFQREWEDITVTQNMWKKIFDEDGLNPTFYYRKELPWLTQYKYDNALINVRKYLDPNNLNQGFINLPESYPFEFEYENGDYVVWTEHYSYQCYPGWIEFTVAFSDFQGVDDEELYPVTETFTILLGY